jgi:hypothetical protein
MSTSSDVSWAIYGGVVPAESNMKTNDVCEVKAVENGWLVVDLEGNVSVAQSVKEVEKLVGEITQAVEDEEEK